jgi:hypothetical protein
MLPRGPPIGDLGLTVVGSVPAARAHACPVAVAISYATLGISGSGGFSASGVAQISFLARGSHGGGVGFIVPRRQALYLPRALVR